MLFRKFYFRLLRGSLEYGIISLNAQILLKSFRKEFENSTSRGTREVRENFSFFVHPEQNRSACCASGDLSAFGCCLLAQKFVFIKCSGWKLLFATAFSQSNNLRLQQPHFGHLSASDAVRFNKVRWGPCFLLGILGVIGVIWEIPKSRYLIPSIPITFIAPTKISLNRL